VDNCVAILSAVIHGVAFLYYDFGQRRARILESSSLVKLPSNRIVATGHLSNTCDAGGNSNRCQRRAIRESTITNTLDASGNSNGFQRSALEESLHANTRHSIRDRDRLQKSATLESRLSNTLHTIGDSNRGKGGATLESLISNTRDAISDFVKYYGLGNNNITLVTHLLTDFCGQFVLVEAVLNAINNFYSHGILMIYVVSCCKGTKNK
jgi:hypothetical protein